MNPDGGGFLVPHDMAPDVQEATKRPPACQRPATCRHPRCRCLPWADDHQADFREALEDFVDAVTDALRIPQALDWLGRVLERADIRRW